ncbi:hypothetical protein D3C76_842170 [compost metagenome]
MTQVDSRQWCAIGQGQVDACTKKVATAQHVGKQAHLATGARPFALNTARWQRGFLADDGDEVFTQFINFVCNGLEKFGTTFRTQLPILNESIFGGQGGTVYFGLCGLIKIVWERLAGGRIQTFKLLLAVGAAFACDKILTKKCEHICLRALQAEQR